MDAIAPETLQYEDDIQAGHFRKPFSSLFQDSSMRSIEEYIEYTRREYCNDVTCPIQLLLNKKVEKSPEYEEIRAICASRCVHTTYEFHHWLIEKGYRIVRPKEP
jgi:hypothetical protein